MKKEFCALIIAVIIAAVSLPGGAQDIQREADDFDIMEMNETMHNIMTKHKSKIRVGMTQAQVRQILGQPGSIHAGFPSRPEGVTLLPTSHDGALLYSSWKYSWPTTKKLVVRLEPKGEETQYFINGRKTTDLNWEQYSQADSVFFTEDGQFYPIASWVEIDASLGRKVIREAVDPQTTYTKQVPAEYVQALYMQFFYVIFEKSSNLVSGAKMYFWRISECEEDDPQTAGMVGSKFKATK